MTTAITTKPKARRPAAKKKLPGAAWIGCGVGKAFIRPGVDLTKPTLPPGKSF